MTDASGGRLEGRVALVTGAGRGQGRAHALALAAEGAAVMVVDVPGPVPSCPYPLASEEDLRETGRLLEKVGAAYRTATVDIRDRVAIDRAVAETIEAFGQLDVLVANAAVCSFSPFEDMPARQWTETIEINLTGTFHTVQAVVPHMKERGYGRIIVTSSMSGRAGNQNLSHYCASKFGVIGMVKAVALELAGTGITANVVCPSTTSTPMIHNDAWYPIFRPDLEHPTEDDVRPVFASLNPLGVPWLPPEAISRAVVYLATDEGFVTGSTLEVGLGLSATKP
jgi:SDR family mycofactocin-dependent oxidoreductase